MRRIPNPTSASDSSARFVAYVMTWASRSAWASIAASATCCESVGGTRNRLPAKRRIGSTSVAGTTAQPRRQPVMHQYFENVLTTPASGAWAGIDSERTPHVIPVEVDGD